MQSHPVSQEGFFCIGSGEESMNGPLEKIRVGVVGRAHGVHGAIRVFMDDAGSDSLLKAKTVFLGPKEDSFKVIHATRCGRFVALELEGIDDRDRAFELTGQEVRILRSELKPLRNAFYACDLVGLEICDENDHRWGRIDAIMPSGAHDLLRYVRPQGGVGYVPFVSAHVGKIDMDARTVQVDAQWMAELDEVYGE